MRGSQEQQRAVYLGLCRAIAALTEDDDAAALLRSEFTPDERATGCPQPGMAVPPLVVERACVRAWVDDDAALLAWCEQTWPGDVETVTVSRTIPTPGGAVVETTTSRRVRPAVASELLEAARIHPDMAPPGITVRRFAPRVVIRLSEPAAAIADHAGGP